MFTIKDVITHILLPLGVFLLIAVYVVDLLAREADQVFEVAPDVMAALSGRPTEPVAGELKLQWESYYGGGNGEDNVMTVQAGSSLRVSTGLDGGWYGARSVLPLEVRDADSISLSVRYANWDKLERVMILFSSGPDFTDYYGINLKEYFARPADHEWRRVVLDRSEVAVVEGTPDWNTITDIAVRVVPVAGESTRVWFDDFAVHVREQNTAVISYTFDDGFATVMQARSIMDQYGMKGTAYIIPEFLGTEGYLTQADVDTLASNGWDIGGHGQTNLTTMPAVEVDADLARVLAYLTEHDYQGKEHYAYPNGGYNESVQSQVREYFTSARTIDGFQQPPEHIIPQGVNAITISNTTPVADIVKAIDTAKARDTWLILVWHDLEMKPELSYEYHPADFAWITKYIADQGISVRPYSAVYQELVP